VLNEGLPSSKTWSRSFFTSVISKSPNVVTTVTGPREALWTLALSCIPSIIALNSKKRVFNLSWTANTFSVALVLTQNFRVTSPFA